MSMIYDNWERLVAAVLKREEIRQLCLQPSRSPSICSESSDCSASFQSRDVRLRKRVASVGKPVPKVVFVGGSSPDFRLKDIVKFCHELGNGTFWTSFLGELLQDVEVSDQELLVSGTEVVIKLWKKVKLPEEEFKQQMKIFGNCRHENVAAPLAYYFSEKANGKLIVYDYHSQGSVSDMLLGKSPTPNWETRLRIAIGAARGIAHVHAQSGGKLAHGNIKASNIFLNSQQYGCVSDFSLTGIMAKPRRGNPWYHTPPYGPASISQEIDVYNFGNLLLELLTGKSSMEAHGFEDDMDLETWVRSIKSQDWTSELFDQCLRRPIRNEKDMIEMVKTEIPGVDLEVQDSVTDWEALRAILRSHFRSMARVPAGYFTAQDLAEMIEMKRVAMRCLRDRPKMTEVVLMLENIKASLSNRKPEHDR
ncbi:probably inactive receptor-like protein kinase At5g41680 [Sesamum indicum]|uniref:Probably inactive receptor-like protein kinase At5g41680 n=1 Tax=Sesamum indicum TaxID=4182 RepID=A0A6I9SZY4_SESIN|nr:probably inactive receptor-like protein kinase At5g41680 [Sesamum indicum]